MNGYNIYIIAWQVPAAPEHSETTTPQLCPNCDKPLRPALPDPAHPDIPLFYCPNCEWLGDVLVSLWEEKNV